MTITDAPKACRNCGAMLDAQRLDAAIANREPYEPCPNPSPGRPFVDCGIGGHMFDVPFQSFATRRVHIPMKYAIVESPICDCDLKSPFPTRPEIQDPDGLGTFAAELCREFGIDSDELSTSDVARAWARTMGWTETPDGWHCPNHPPAALHAAADAAEQVK